MLSLLGVSSAPAPLLLLTQRRREAAPGHDGDEVHEEENCGSGTTEFCRTRSVKLVTFARDVCAAPPWQL